MLNDPQHQYPASDIHNYASSTSLMRWPVGSVCLSVTCDEAIDIRIQLNCFKNDVIWHFNDDVMTWKTFSYYWFLVIGDAITLMWRHFNDNTGNELMGFVIHENQISWDALRRYFLKLILSVIFEQFFDIFCWDVKYRSIVHWKHISTTLCACCEHRDFTIPIFQTCRIFCALYIYIMCFFKHNMI